MLERRDRLAAADRGGAGDAEMTAVDRREDTDGDGDGDAPPAATAEGRRPRGQQFDIGKDYFDSPRPKEVGYTECMTAFI